MTDLNAALEMSRDTESKVDLPVTEAPENSAPMAVGSVTQLTTAAEPHGSARKTRKIITVDHVEGEGLQAVGVAKVHDYVENPEAILEQARQALKAQLAGAEKAVSEANDALLMAQGRLARIQKALQDPAVAEAPAPRKRRGRQAKAAPTGKPNGKLKSLLEEGWHTIGKLAKLTGKTTDAVREEMAGLKTKRRGERRGTEYRL